MNEHLLSKLEWQQQASQSCLAMLMNQHSHHQQACRGPSTFLSVTHWQQQALRSRLAMLL